MHIPKSLDEPRFRRSRGGDFVCFPGVSNRSQHDTVCTVERSTPVEDWIHCVRERSNTKQSEQGVACDENAGDQSQSLPSAVPFGVEILTVFGVS